MKSRQQKIITQKATEAHVQLTKKRLEASAFAVPKFRPYLFLTTLWLIFSLFISNTATAKSQIHTIRLNAQPLSKALFALSEQTDIAIFASADLLKGLQSSAINGNMTVEQALKKLLSGSSLVFEKVRDGYVITAEKSETSKPDIDTSIATNKPDVKKMTIIGTRLANRQSLSTKQDSTRIMDALTADDIGELPDINAADSFRRITGLNTLNDSDEGQFVVVRGISPGMNFVTLDGMAIASDHSDTRGINLETMPASAVASLEVYKNVSPDLEANSTGGNMNMTSYSAFERKDDFLQIDFNLAKYSLDDVPDNDDGLSGDFKIDYSTTLGENNQYGLVLAGVYSKKKRDEKKWDPRFRYIKNTGGADSAFRQRFNTAQYTNTWNRQGGTIKLEFSPGFHLHAYLQSYFYKLTEKEDRDIWNITNEAGDNVIFNASGTASTPRARGEVNYTFRPTYRQLSGNHFHFDFDFDRQHEISFDIAQSKGGFKRPQHEVVWRTNTDNEALEALAYTYQENSDFPDWSFSNASFAENTDNYFFDVFKDKFTQVENRVTDIKADYNFNASSLSSGLGVKIGVRHRRNKLKNNSQQSNVFWQGAASLSLTAFSELNHFTPPHFDNIMPFQNEVSFFSFYNATPDSFGTIAEDVAYFNQRDDFYHRETISSGYGLTQYNADNWQIISGVRYESTDNYSQGVLRNLDSLTVSSNDYKSSSSDWLPSISARYHVNDYLRIQAAWGRSLGRPELSDINAIESIKTGENEQIITRKNTTLKPSLSDNYDLSFEYYFDDDNLFSVALFKKDIKRFPLFEQTQTSNPQTNVTTIINETTNHASANIKGIEVSLIKNNFDFLPSAFDGLGLAGNATWTKAKLNYLDLQGNWSSINHLSHQPDFMANLIVFYNFWNELAELRLGYNYTDHYSDQVITDKSLREEDIWKPFEQIDTQLRVDISQQLTLKFKVRNLMNRTRKRATGLHQELLEHEVIFGRSVWLGLTYSY
ncbi:TonB-dependent receptor [Aliikangiella coralliicola]|uniref:TonB-dependent receptor n=1 Tax=Aliikangiella coralliicola TaxID=2592383 RepID=A0A545UC39_9GAMM|nr:TonB-dependent receptor [Aliikangiella coralliicola]TQV87030.1 TonB-dependent receptor [Aliikangiella coralliicola]